MAPEKIAQILSDMYRINTKQSGLEIISDIDVHSRQEVNTPVRFVLYKHKRMNAYFISAQKSLDLPYAELFDALALLDGGDEPGLPHESITYIQDNRLYEEVAKSTCAEHWAVIASKLATRKEEVKDCLDFLRSCVTDDEFLISLGSRNTHYPTPDIDKGTRKYSFTISFVVREEDAKDRQA